MSMRPDAAGYDCSWRPEPRGGGQAGRHVARCSGQCASWQEWLQADWGAGSRCSLPLFACSAQSTSGLHQQLFVAADAKP